MRRYIRALWHLLNRRSFIRTNLGLTLVDFKFDGERVMLEGKYSIALANDIFFNDEYAELDVRGKTVIDIGANIGDTAIYFARTGARRVIAIEPFPCSFNLLTKNVARNGMAGKIQHYLAAVGKSSEVICLPETEEGGIFQAKDAGSGHRINVLTLEEAMKYEHPPFAVKCDAEGAEYEIFLNAPDETLRKIDEIMMEYHGKSEPLIARLEKAGFRARRKGNHIHAVRLET